MLKLTVKAFKALADTNRIRIMKMLQSRPLCVCEITSVLDLAPSTVSKHLSILREAGLIVDERDAKWVNYRMENNPPETGMREVLSLVRGMLEKDGTVISDRRKAASADRNSICSGAVPTNAPRSTARRIKR